MAEAGTIQVVAAVVERGGRYLMGRRPQGKRHAGLWEFPGGKMLKDESYLDAARRELDEELALQVTGVGATLFSAEDPGSPFVVNFVQVTVTGDAHASEHSDIGWFDAEELVKMALAPSDAACAEWLTRRG